MSNPARELHVIYQGWRDANPEGKRSLQQVVRPLGQGLAHVATATRLLVRISDLLTYFENEGLAVAVYRRQYAAWWAPVLAHPHGWGGVASAEATAAQSTLDQIEGFAAFLDGKVYSISSEGTETLREILDRAAAVLEEDASLDAELRVYIHRLLQSIRIALDDDAVGVATDYAECVRQLWVALRAAEGASKTKGSEWRGIWTQIATAATAGALVEGGSILLKSITGGA
jgi:hypothetical protein